MEAYLATNRLTSKALLEAVDDMARQTAAFLVRFGKEDKAEMYE